MSDIMDRVRDVLDHLDEVVEAAMVEDDPLLLLDQPEDGDVAYTWARLIATMQPGVTSAPPTVSDAAKTVAYMWDRWIAASNSGDPRDITPPPEDPDLAAEWSRFWSWLKHAVLQDVPLLFPHPMWP